MDSREEFLDSVSNKLRVLREAKSLYAARLAPDFRLFQHVIVHEMNLSAILADLLSPTGTHGQGSKFLEVFLSQFEPSLGNNRKNIVSAKVITEFRTQENRRIDIVIDIKNDIMIGIENKLWVGDSDNQLEDYANDLKKIGQQKNINWCIVYLSGRGESPSKNSIKPDAWKGLIDKNKAKELSYKYIAEWLEECMGKCKSERVWFFLGELRRYIDSEFNGAKDMDEQKEIVELAIRNEHNLSAALQIDSAISAIKNKLLDRLYGQLTDRLEKKSWKIKRKFNYGEPYSRIGIDFGSDSPCLDFEFQHREFQSWVYGISASDKERPDAAKKLNERISGESNKYWYWYRFIKDEAYRNWSSSEKPWLGILDGRTTAEFILKKAQDIYDVLKT